MATLEAFIKEQCDDRTAGGLRGLIARADGAGYRELNFNVFDVELFFAENVVVIADVLRRAPDHRMSIDEFLAAIPAAAPNDSLRKRPRDPIVPPAPE